MPKCSPLIERPARAAASSITTRPAAASAGVQSEGSQPSDSRPQRSSAAGTRAAQPHLERLLHGQGGELDVAERAGGPVVAHRLAGPQPAQQRERFVDEGAALLGLDADGLALRREGEPGHQRHQQAALGEPVQARELLGEPQDIASRQEHGGPDLQARVARGGPGEADHRIEHRAGQHLREPEGVEPELVEAGHQLGHRLHGCGRARGTHPDADLHRGVDSTASGPGPGVSFWP